MRRRSREPSPRELGYRFPAEWEPQSATWLSWPRPEGISFPGRYHTVPANIAAIVRAIATRQHVRINVPNENYERIVREQLLAGGVPKALLAARVSCHYIPTNEAWCRDHGPAFLTRTRRGKRGFAIVDFGFNAWGGKYPPYDADDAVPTRIHALVRAPGGAKVRLFSTPFVMEGGSVDFNGRGTVLTTEQCLLNKNRNPTLNKAQIERVLKDSYGQSRVVWLGEGIEGDDTDGHVDDLARFIDPSTVVVGVEDDPKDANHKPLRDCVRRLRLARDQHGKPFRVVELPMPGRVERDGQRLPATYMNFLFVNGALLLPTYRHKKHDAKARAILRELLPKHQIVPIDCTELIWGLGSIHCLTQQVPRGVRVLSEPGP
jgi:agmatine deiminase